MSRKNVVYYIEDSMPNTKEFKTELAMQKWVDKFQTIHANKGKEGWWVELVITGASDVKYYEDLNE